MLLFQPKSIQPNAAAPSRPNAASRRPSDPMTSTCMPSYPVAGRVQASSSPQRSRHPVRWSYYTCNVVRIQPPRMHQYTVVWTCTVPRTHGYSETHNLITLQQAHCRAFRRSSGLKSPARVLHSQVGPLVALTVGFGYRRGPHVLSVPSRSQSARCMIQYEAGWKPSETRASGGRGMMPPDGSSSRRSDTLADGQENEIEENQVRIKGKVQTSDLKTVARQVPQ